jgi:MoaA/NifB/PqqE/SkfB family radical SAM enzyme
MLPVYADELVALDVTHVTITINAVDPAIGAKIYKYVDYRGRRYHGETAAAILLANQLAGLEMLAKRGVICKVNIVTLKGINDIIFRRLQTVKDLGGESQTSCS